jgi:hypothetical protein
MGPNTNHVAGVVQASDVWAKVLGHYDIERGNQLRCLLDSELVDYVNDGDTLLTLAVKAFDHEREHHA